MQSSFNVIKDNSVINSGEKKIETYFKPKTFEEQKNSLDEGSKAMVESYESIGKIIMENARSQVDAIMKKAYENAEAMHQEAYEKGFELGKQEGYDAAYEEGYKKNMEQAYAEAQNLILAAKEAADNMIASAKMEHERYLKEKEQEIRHLVMNAVESMLKREVKDPEALDRIVFEALSGALNTESFVVKVNSLHYDSLKNNVEHMKNTLPFKGDIFIVIDDSLEDGSAVIQRDSGKMEVSVENALDKLREMLAT